MSLSLLLILGLLVVWLYRRYKWACIINRIPGTSDSTFGLLGDIDAIVRNIIMPVGENLTPMQNVLRVLSGTVSTIKHQGLVKIWLGPYPHLVAADADAAEAILSSNELITKGLQYKFLQKWLGMGLLTALNNEKWRRNRKMLTPSFHFKILEDFVPVMSRNGKILVNRLEQEAAKNEGVVEDISPFILLCALDVICETAMGERVNAQSDPEGKYIRAVHDMSTIIMHRSLKPWTFVDAVFDATDLGKREKETLEILHGFTDSVIKRRKEKMSAKILYALENAKTDERRKEPFMDTLIREHLAHPNEFTEKNIREEVDTFMFEGHDTTAWGVIWSTYLLGLNPECQQKVHEEVDALFEGKGDDDDLTLDEMRTGLDYTEAVAKEAQRLYPSVPIFSRRTIKDTGICGHEVPAGTFLLVIPTLIHHDEKYWPQAARFMPERFLSRDRRMHPYSFIPFSAGSRNCVGQKFAMLEEKALIAKIFRKFNVTSLDQRDKVVPSASLILKSATPIRIRLEVRQR